MENMYSIIKRPLISEKTLALQEVGNVYAFEVTPDSNKIEIRQAIQKLFNVKVKAVRTMTVHGKEKRRGLHTVKNTNWKKALVTLAEGQKIDFFGTSK